VKIEHLTRLLDAEYGAGFKAGIEAAAKDVESCADEIEQGDAGWLARRIRSLSPVAKEESLHDPTTCDVEPCPNCGLMPPTREHDHTSDSGDCLACLVPPVREREGCARCAGSGKVQTKYGGKEKPCPACNHAAA
jgi:hypothetical protein